MFYNWRKIEGYNIPIIVVVGPRGLGKTFPKVKGVLCDFVDNESRFVYVVETIEDVKTLSANRGERFFSAIKEYLENETSKRSQHYYSALFGQNSAEIEEGETDLVDTDNNFIQGGTIKISGKTAGYLIAINSYGNLKRNNFVNIKTIIIDEFIPEEIDINFSYPISDKKKLWHLLQTSFTAQLFRQLQEGKMSKFICWEIQFDLMIYCL